MDFENYKAQVVSHMNSLIQIYGLVLVVCLMAIVFTEIYIRRKMELRFLEIGKWQINPSLFLVLVCTLTIIIGGVKVRNCILDVQSEDYQTYIGVCNYQTEAVKLEDIGISIYVGKGHDKVPQGKHYGKCVYAKRSKVIVAWEYVGTDQSVSETSDN